MTTPDLDALAEMLAKATSGPWVAGGSIVDEHGKVIDAEWVWEGTGHHSGDPDAPDTRICSASTADARLIAALHNAAPQLLAIARAVRGLGEARRDEPSFDLDHAYKCPCSGCESRRRASSALGAVLDLSDTLAAAPGGEVR